MDKSSCFICELAAGRDAGSSLAEEVLYEDELTIAILSSFQLRENLGKILVAPKNHITIQTVSNDVKVALFDTVTAMEKLQKERLGSIFSIGIQNIGYTLQSSSHLLFHVTPSFTVDWPTLNKAHGSVLPVEERKLLLEKLQ